MQTDFLICRHIGVNEEEIASMLSTIGVSTVEQLIEETIPDTIRLKKDLDLPEAMTEREYSEHIAEMADKNELFTSYIGMGWYDTSTPPVILRHVFENPCWYTSYTPYQAEISQGRLEALFNFQTMISDLTALPLANASLLDEATAAAEAANLLLQTRSKEQVKNDARVLLLDRKIFDSTLSVLNTHLQAKGFICQKLDYKTVEFTGKEFGVILQYPNSDGSVENYASFIKKSQLNGVKVAVAADLLSLCLLTPPGEWGADVVFGSAQRFGIPMYYGGPSAGYFATKEIYKRYLPGRIVGVSKDAYGKKAFRLALQTREQHIKREKATSNICTAQALLAIMSSFYAIYHGQKGLKIISERIHSLTGFLAKALTRMGYVQENEYYFDTLKVQLPLHTSLKKLKETALANKVNLRYFKDGKIGISLDETTLTKDIGILLSIFSAAINQEPSLDKDIPDKIYFDHTLKRTSPYLTQEVFNTYHTETELMRYIKRLEKRDISLVHSMISLGSCTMKLNPSSTMLPLNNSQWANIHPYAPKEQTEGYKELIDNLASYLSKISGLPGVNFQPNSGAAGEFAGLMTIRSYYHSIGQGYRNIVLIPASSHGTNPASANQAGFRTVTIRFDENGNTDLLDLQAKIEEYKEQLAALMITYPSTHGIFESNIVEVCHMVHRNGGQVYMDGANMNAQVGLTHPGEIGADICHLNLHKTFAIPHGGGGPGAGPICVAQHLIPFLPSHPEKENHACNTVTAAPFGNAGILQITYGYIRMMGASGLKIATQIAILNANYLAVRLEKIYGVVYKGHLFRVGHELILDCRTIRSYAGIDETDIAKRLIDYGFHAPTLSFPVHGTLMIEPTESESLRELDRFVEAMILIREEIEEISCGKADKKDNVLINAPHPQYEVCGDDWSHLYTRTKAAFPSKWVEENKFWVHVARVDNAWGDRQLVIKKIDRNQNYQE